MKTQVVYAALTVPCDWILTIVDENQSPVRNYSGSGTSSYIQWDGTDSFGTPLPPGFYDYILTATPQQGEAAIGGGEGATAPEGQSTVAVASQASTTRKQSLVDEIRSCVPVPQSPLLSLSTSRAARSRVLWFMRPKPDLLAAITNAPAFTVPPIPPLVRTKFNAQDWDALLADYLLKSNNMV
jgi:hypothetical protein